MKEILNSPRLQINERLNSPLFGSFIVIIACLLPISVIAQMRTPENIPIAFYGKVIDQNGSPVVGAKVDLEVGIDHYELNTSEEKNYALESDQNGNFTLTNAFGAGFDISIGKTGYELSQKTLRSYVYTVGNIFHPDPNNPVVFKMWKIAGKEPLVSSAWHGKVACDGTTNRYDLISGHPDTSGALEIICSRTPLTVPPPGSAHFDYKFQIRVHDGSIQPTEDEFTYLAPENGYSPSLTVAQKADDPKWRASVTQEFYIKTADGHYGRLFVDWYAWQTPPVHLEWDCSINPSGSHNLER
jgi:hypothetical protein